MIMKHVLLEMYCKCNTEKEKPNYCDVIGHNCIHHNCKYLSTTCCPNEIAFAGSTGVVESFDDCIGFGGEMEPETLDSSEYGVLLSKWKEICKKKIDEAYDEYMEFKNKRIIE
ncbi:hypothetical protein [Clostridium felsineum]|uniref:Uncharacterized protein n=1 Tax=Clostridium felsineum TaxID=36839 RepID=A0A1S8L2B2_9CLOT|nr:hypothetical protein [Clostridium felsineum]URZ05407.1 hypothetical protein CLROS_007330 [Clostridium felsineum]URZ10448.1 hypothetical protein CROST_011580 [Clostridium felsineum]